jgi:putative cardiolipin synthase
VRSLSRLLLCLLACGFVACAQLPPRPELPLDAALPAGASTRLDALVGAAETLHPGQSGFRLVVEGPEAMASRARGAQIAERSLDVQTYIWHADLTGLYVAYQLLEAADRGVRVRVLLDDMDARAKNAGLAALAAHPSLDVRLFNPFGSRRGMLGFIGEGLTDFGRINRRMHNKTWIADNRIALVGGRNVGDEYFGASDESNFVDLDFAMVGPVVREASASFDRYWNSPAAYPMEVLDPAAVNTQALARLREQLRAHAAEAQTTRYAQALRAYDAVQRLEREDWPMHWTDTWRFIADDPAKLTMSRKDVERSPVGAALLDAVAATRTRTNIVSPYFVPGERGTAAFIEAAQSGRDVRILTNSLMANDVAAVHGGYSRYRKPLLAGGVQLWELKPLPGNTPASSVFGSSGASLHTKALTIDGETLFVGSYNIDPRSTWLNCEQGVLVQSAELTRQLDELFASQTAGDRAWRVTLENGDLRWSDGNETFRSDPKATLGLRFQAWITRVLGLDAQL